MLLFWGHLLKYRVLRRIPALHRSSLLFRDRPRFYADTSGMANQIECQPGKYQPSPSQEGCLEPVQVSLLTSMSTDQTPCPAGTYNPVSSAINQSACIESGEGHYVPSPGSSRQSPCIAGTFQNQTRQVSCIEADPGNYVPVDASSSQTACSPGQYQPSPGQIICFSTDPGYFTAEQSSSSQEACQPGTYQPSSGQTSCLDTVPGYFAPDSGQSDQTPAPLDHYVPNPRSSSTELCPEGTITISSASVSVDYCLSDTDGDRITTEQIRMMTVTE